MNDIPKKQMRDVIVPQNDIIRVPVQTVRVQASVEPQVTSLPKEESARIEKNPFFAKGKKKENELLKDSNPRSHALVLAFSVVVLLTLGFVVANYFASATVEITPITRNITVDHDFTAVASGGAKEGNLIFNYVATSTEKTKEVPATVEKKIQKKASGKVLIFNSYNGEKQRLIKNTRLESPDRKIFRIDESVVVPGAKMAGGKVVEPGSVIAIVYADVAGEKYNIGLSDFTIPGFKGDPRYAKFTAKSKTDSPIAGGFSGTVKVPSDASLATAKEELKQDLKKIAVEKARAQIPDGMLLFPGSVVIKFEEVPEEFTESVLSKVIVRATASVFFFDRIILTQKLAEALPPEDNGKTFVIQNIPALTFSFVDSVDNVVLSDLLKINFHIKGDTSLVGYIDTEKIRMDLAGKDEKDVGKIIVDQNGIDRADVVIRPMWKTAFPSDPAKITIKILN